MRFGVCATTIHAVERRYRKRRLFYEHISIHTVI